MHKLSSKVNVNIINRLFLTSHRNKVLFKQDTCVSGGTMMKCCHKYKNLELQYEKAITCLNELQSNAAVISKIRKNPSRSQNNIPLTLKYLNKISISSQDLNKLSVIHVAGTKGKGSTCAFIESILQENGYKTGLYTSPHLVAVRERIRLNGKPIEKELFLSYFWDVYNTLHDQKEDKTDMPAYFKFLTILAFKVFLQEQVDVVILEVGIGGEHDCTNVIEKPVVCGITSLDIDHTSLLGSTIESIAWHKAGIMKPNVPCFTVRQSFSQALEVLEQRSLEKQTEVFVVPSLEKYNWGGLPMKIGLSGEVQFLNASLALQLSQYWLQNYALSESHRKRINSTTDEDCSQVAKVAEAFSISEEDLCGLSSVVWPGRTQVLSRDHMTFFLDGAHTTASIKACVDWFNKASPLHYDNQQEKGVFKAVLFNSTGDRDPETLLQHLVHCNFDIAVFTTNLTTINGATSDQTNFTITEDQQHLRCERQRSSWVRLVRNGGNISSVKDSLTKELVDDNDFSGSDAPTIIFPCISDALNWLTCGRCSGISTETARVPPFVQPEKLQSAVKVQVLVTGSLHLVGGVLGMIDPAMSSSEHICSSSMREMLKKKYNHIYSTPGTP